LRSVKNEIETFWEDEGSVLEEENPKIVKGTKETSKSRKFSKDKVFIIHGHDEGTKEKVARFLEKIELKPIILHEKPNEGQTIIEKFEKHSLDVGFAIALLTPDDVGNSKLYKENLNYRARQNVILELGFFIGKLGRKRVCAMLGKDVEIPSDYSGILYISLEEETWQYKLAKELKTAGFQIDMNKVL
jgi:predicted nucleotide-binding protein